MDNAQAQIEELQQQIEFLRDQLARSNAKILKCEKDFAALEATSKNEIVKMWKRFQDLADAQHNDRTQAVSHIGYIYKGLREVDGCLWPVVHKVFPNYGDDMERVAALIGEPALPPGEIVPKIDV